MDENQPKPFVFVLMPFAKEFDDLYQLGIKAACQEAGAYCERVDESYFEEGILSRIYNQISKADIVVAEMTGRNPNVFYEVGYAHALGKRVVLLTANDADIPFDLTHYSHIIHCNRIVILKEELRKRVEWCIAHPAGSPAQAETGVKFYCSGREITPGCVLAWGGGGFAQLDLTLSNPTHYMYAAGSLRVGLITPEGVGFGYSHGRGPAEEERRSARWIKLPDGRGLHLLTWFDGAVFPSGWEDLWSGLTFTTSANPGDIYDVAIRLFTEIGAKDLPFRLKCVKNGPYPFAELVD